MSPGDGKTKEQPVATTRGRAGPHRRPTKRACIDCHARKVKCDGATNGFPCSNCKASQVECAVADRRKRKRQTASTQNARGRPRAKDSRSSSESPCGNGSAPRQVSDAPDVHGPEEENQDQPEHDADRADAGQAAEDELAKEHLVEFFNQDLQDNPIRARSTYVGSELSNLNYLVRQRSANQRVYHYPCSNVYVPRVFRNSQVPVTPNLIPKDAFVLPPKHISDILVADYFDHVHPGLPILDKDSFLSQYHDSDSAPSTLLFQAVCLVGSHVTSKFRNHQEMKAAFFRRAKALLDGRYEEDRMHVVQAAILLTWFSDGGDDICANSWWWIGIAARTAIGLGMHREVGPSKMPDQDKLIWRRIWWCVVQFDCLVTLFYGRPQQLNLDDCDVPQLVPEDFESCSTPNETDFVIHHSRLCTTISELVRSHFSVKANKLGIDRRAALDAIDEALASWLVNLPPGLRHYSRSSDRSGPWAALLHLTYNTALLQFHRSSSSMTSNLAESSRTGDEEICVDAAANIIHVFEQLHQSSSLHYCWFWAPSALFAAMLQVSGQLKSNNPILELRANAKYESSLRILRRLSRHWLFATSIWRLFQSNSIKAATANSGRSRNDADSTVALQASDEVSPPQYSPIASIPSVAATSSHSEQVVTLNQGPGLPHHSTEMDWVQLFSFNDANTGFMNVESNRWQNNPDQWQSLYFSDPLANIHLGDTFGSLPFEWPS